MATTGMATSGRTPPQAARRTRRGLLAAVTAAASAAVLLALFAVADVTVAPDGTLHEPFWALALGMLALTAAGVIGLALAFRAVRRRSTCGRGGC